MRRAVLGTMLLLALAGCSGGDDDDDGGSLEHHHFVANGMEIPLDTTASTELGFDLDGDSTVDNQFGSVMVALFQASGSGPLDPQALVDEAILRGDLIALADIQAGEDIADDGSARFALYEGSAPTPAPCTVQTDLLTCGQHLDGNGSFTASGSATGAEGEIGGTTLTADGGAFNVPFPFLGAIPSVGAIEVRVSLAGVSATGFGGASKIGGAIPEAEIDTVIVPSLQVWAAAIVAEDCALDCSGCTCVADSLGGTLADLFDDDASCTITMSDLEASSLLDTLLRPDVDTDGDTVADAMSFGVGVSAVAATYTDPS